MQVSKIFFASSYEQRKLALCEFFGLARAISDNKTCEIACVKTTPLHGCCKTRENLFYKVFLQNFFVAKVFFCERKLNSFFSMHHRIHPQNRIVLFGMVHINSHSDLVFFIPLQRCLFCIQLFQSGVYYLRCTLLNKCLSTYALHNNSFIVAYFLDTRVVVLTICS